MIMYKTSIYSVDALWMNVARNFSLIFLFTLVAFMFWFAYKESFLQNALNLLQNCINWLRKQPIHPKQLRTIFESNNLQNADETQSQEQSRLNHIIEDQKDELITQTNSNIANKKIQTLMRQNQRQRQQLQDQELSELEWQNQEPYQIIETDGSNQQQDFVKSSQIMQLKQTGHPQMSIGFINQKELRNYKSYQSQNNLRIIKHNIEQINPENPLKKHISLESRTLEDTIHKKDIQIKNLEANLTKAQKQNKYLKGSLQNTQKISGSSIDRENKLRKRIGQLQKVNEQSNSQKLVMQKQIEELQNTQRQQIDQKKKLKNELKLKLVELSTLTQRNKPTADYIHKLQLQNYNKNIEIQNLRSQVQANQKSINKQVQEIRSLKQQYNQIYLSQQSQEQLILKQDEDLKKLQKTNTELKQELQEHQEQSQQVIDNLNKRRQELLNGIKRKEQQIEAKNKQLQILHRDMRIQSKQYLKLQDQITHYEEKLKNFSVMEQQVKDLKLQIQSADPLIHLFTGEIIDDQLQHKQFIKQAIEDYTKKKIVRTKKLYTSEKDLNFSFHKYVDDVPDIVVVLKTVSSFYLAGYSQSPISTTVIANKGGLIMALNNRKVFRLIKGKRSVIYDNFSLIIGNSEIRLKNQQWKVFSNFAISDSFFDSNGCSVNDLLGEGPAARQVSIVDFEVHRVYFK